MSVTHFRVSRLESKVGITAHKMFIFSSPRALGCCETEFSDDDSLRLAGRERQQSDMVVVLAKFYDPADPDSKNRTIWGSPVSEIALLSASELRDEVRHGK